MLAISFWMIRCCFYLLNLGQFAQFFDQLELKVTSLVGQQFFRETIICYKFIPEGSCCCLTRQVGGDDSFCMSCEMVCDEQDAHNAPLWGFLLSQSPCALTPEDKLLITDKALLTFEPQALLTGTYMVSGISLQIWPIKPNVKDIEHLLKT